MTDDFANIARFCSIVWMVFTTKAQLLTQNKLLTELLDDILLQIFSWFHHILCKNFLSRCTIAKLLAKDSANCFLLFTVEWKQKKHVRSWLSYWLWMDCLRCDKEGSMVDEMDQSRPGLTSGVWVCKPVASVPAFRAAHTFSETPQASLLF